MWRLALGSHHEKLSGTLLRFSEGSCCELDRRLDLLDIGGKVRELLIRRGRGRGTPTPGRVVASRVHILMIV